MKIINRDKLANEIFYFISDRLLDKEIKERCIPAVVGYAFESNIINKFDGKLHVSKKLCQILFTVSKVNWCEDVEKTIITELSVNILYEEC